MNKLASRLFATDHFWPALLRSVLWMPRVKNTPEFAAVNIWRRPLIDATTSPFVWKKYQHRSIDPFPPASAFQQSFDPSSIQLFSIMNLNVLQILFRLVLLKKVRRRSRLSNSPFILSFANILRRFVVSSPTEIDVQMFFRSDFPTTHCDFSTTDFLLRRAHLHTRKTFPGTMWHSQVVTLPFLGMNICAIYINERCLGTCPSSIFTKKRKRRKCRRVIGKICKYIPAILTQCNMLRWQWGQVFHSESSISKRRRPNAKNITFRNRPSSCA